MAVRTITTRLALDMVEVEIGRRRPGMDEKKAGA